MNEKLYAVAAVLAIAITGGIFYGLQYKKEADRVAGVEKRCSKNLDRLSKRLLDAGKYINTTLEERVSYLETLENGTWHAPEFEYCWEKFGDSR
tara:strand:+ start:66 stop:347 length:282 start_codon:yes stop_codon:yes gene_type:complete